MTFQNLRFALRMMRKNPAFTAVAAGTLALGIGANTAIFSVVNAVVISPLPVKDPASVVAITASSPARGITGYSVSLASYENFRDGSRLMTDVAAFGGDSLTLTGEESAEQLPVARVSPNYFDLLGGHPLLGRSFRDAEGASGAPGVAIISHDLWQRRMGGDRGILERTITLNQEPYAVIGVMPPDYRFPFQGVDVWVTRLIRYGGLQPEQIQQGAGYLNILARLRPGVTLAQAGEEAQALHEHYKRDHPRAPDGSADSRYTVTSLQDSLTLGIRSTLTILVAAVGFVLLIACANVAALLMARATTRAKEMALRAALGASRRQLIWQLLAECVLLSLAGAAVGVALANWGVEWLVKADAGNNLPGYRPIGMNLAVLVFTAAISIATGVAFGLIPALQVSRPDLNGILRDSGWGSLGGSRGNRMRNTLVIAQIGLSIVLLIGAGLLIESFRQVQNIRLGFDAVHTLTARLALPPTKYANGPQRTEVVHEIIRRLETEPGVTSAAISQSVPLNPPVLSAVLAEGQPFVALPQRPLARWSGASPGFFQTLGVPLMSGRDFSWADDEKAPRVVIINESLARRFWPGQNAIGKHITFTRLQVPHEVIGVVGDTRTGNIENDPPMAMYSSYAQWTWQTVSLTVRTSLHPMSLAPRISSQIAAVDKDLALNGTISMQDLVGRALLQRQETTYLIAGFAGLALVLAMIGLYGVISYSVAQRSSEIGIRQAIGAQRGDILRMVLQQGLRLSLAGIGAGAIAAALLTRLLSRLLFHVSATDPATFAIVAGAFLLVGVAASCLPAWRATRVDPLVALRSR
ncbi:MAG TPA: ABC transporter permease [Bryobacteraceae bacterium]|nr:ABC transporter permease [Bryobacteraceae bacterium]